jgi:protein-tyrosine phosphatase
MDNCSNFRHLGGYQSRTGGKIKHNLLYRSGTLEFLSEGDIKRLESLKISLIIDFRRKDEINKSPSLIPTYLKMQQLNLSISSGNLIEVFGKKNANYTNMRMINLYRELALEHHEPYASFLNELLKPSAGGILFHCRAGKDRTGFAAALLMMALEVPRDIIIEDYLLTEKYFIPEIQAPIFLDTIPDSSGSYNLSKEILMSLLSAREEYIQAAFDAIDANFESEKDYLSTVFGFDEDKQKAIQNRYLVC